MPVRGYLEDHGVTPAKADALAAAFMERAAAGCAT